MARFRAIFTATGSVGFTADDPEAAVRVASELCSFGVPVGADWNGAVEIVDIEDEDDSAGARLRGEL